MTHVDLVYDADCPNVGAARAQLRRAFAAAGLEPRWREWDRSAADSPPELRRYASPTILVDGEDVEPVPTPDGGSACRVYLDGDAGCAPGLNCIVAALTRSAREPASRPDRGQAVPSASTLDSRCTGTRSG